MPSQLVQDQSQWTLQLTKAEEMVKEQLGGKDGSLMSWRGANGRKMGTQGFLHTPTTSVNLLTKDDGCNNVVFVRVYINFGEDSPL